MVVDSRSTLKECGSLDAIAALPGNHEGDIIFSMWTASGLHRGLVRGVLRELGPSFGKLFARRRSSRSIFPTREHSAQQ
jgi:hypothetical protein